MAKRNLTVSIDEETYYLLKSDRDKDRNMSSLINNFLKTMFQTETNELNSVEVIQKELQKLEQDKINISRKITTVLFNLDKAQKQHDKEFAEEVERGLKMRETYLLNRKQ
jgi:hypothetical protein